MQRIDQPAFWSGRGKWYVLLVTGLAGGIAVGCSDMITEPASAAYAAASLESDIARIDVRPWIDTLAAGASVQLNAVASDESGNEIPGVTFEWSTNRTGVATVDGAGKVSGVGGGLATITARAGDQEGYAAIQVQGSVPQVASVSITPSAGTVAVDRTTQLVATAVDGSGDAVSGLSFSWSSSAPGVASVSSSGAVTGIAAGTATITASAGGQSATASISVVPAGEPVAGVRVLPWRSAIEGGETLQLRAVLTDASGNELSGREVEWSTNRPGVATVDENGLVTGLSSGLATITAESEGRSGHAAVRVNGTATAVASVEVTPNAASLDVDATVNLSAIARDQNGATLDGRTFVWESSNPSVATVNSSGVVTAIAAGSATITASTGGQSGSAAITVNASAAVVTSVLVSPNSASVQAGRTVQLAASAFDQGGNAMPGRTFSWSSSNTTVATVSASGVVTGVAAGSVTIRATTGGVSGTSNVSVTSAPAPTVATVAVSPNSTSVQTGSTVQLTATARDANGNLISGRTFTWVSSNTGVATVNSSGVVSGVAAGTVTVTATTGGQSGASSVTVTNPPPTGTNNVLFFSDWRTARGNTMAAVTDGGKWDFVSAEYGETMEIVSSSGLDFPTTNAYRVIATASRSGWSELRHRSLPIPAVGQSRFYRWYMRVTMPDGLSDEQTHPIQDNYLQNWGFIIYNGGGGAGVPNGMWRPEFWAMGANWPNDRWRAPALQKNQTYRIELQIQRTATSTFAMHVRIYDSAGTLVRSDDDFRSNDGAFRLSSNPTLPLGNVNALNGITAGNNGIGGSPNFPFTVSYQAGFAVCANTWCGAYNGSY